MWHKSLLQSQGLRPGPKTTARIATILIFAGVGGTGAALAQDANANGPASTSGRGLQLRTAAGYLGYYSNGLANTSFQSGTSNLQYDVGGGASATFEYTKLGERSSFAVSYTPSYTGQIRYSSLNTLNHGLSLTASRKLAPRWNFTFSAAGDLSSLQQSQFSPTRLSSVASVPSTFDDLAAGVLSARFGNNPQLANVLASAPLAQSPLLTLLYGQRIFTSAAQISLSYSYSPRLSVAFSGGISRTQPVSNDQSSTNFQTSLLSNTTSGNASVTVSYSLSPLTQAGGTVTTSRVSSTLQDSYITTSLATFGRTIGRHWFVQIHGGAGITNPVRQTSFAASTKPRPAIGGSLGFKTFSSTLLGAYDRSVSDPYGTGASTSSTTSATWQWRQPGRAWRLESSVSWQQLGSGALVNAAPTNTALTNTSGWNISAGFGRSLGPHFALHTQYSYLYYRLNANNNLSQSAVRTSLVWTRNPASMQ